MATPGHLGKRARSFGSAHRNRHRLNYTQGSSTPLVHYVQKKHVQRKIDVQNKPDETVATDVDAGTEEPSVAATTEANVQRWFKREPPKPAPSTTSSSSGSKDASDKDDADEEPGVDEVADQVYRMMLEEFRDYYNRYGRRRSI